MDKKEFKRDLLIWVIVFGVLSIPFALSKIDIAFQRPFYNAEDGWFLANVPFWDFIYKYGIFLGYFLVVAALVVVSVSYWKKSVVQWRRPAFFLLVVMIIGPGVLVNATLKDHWGHPRPREIKEFGGKDDYVKIWVKCPAKGKSFPCGHASMGFFMSIPFLFLRKRFKKWAWGFFIFGTLYGLLIGFARMVAGGHFAGDVLWAAGVVWISGIVAYHLMNVNKPIDVRNFSSPENKKKRRLATVLMGIILPVLTVGLLLATPYISNRQIKIERQELDDLAPRKIISDLGKGVVNISFANDLELNFVVNAFGFPNSKVRFDWIEADTAVVKLTAMGWFTEFRNKIDLIIPENCNWQNKISISEGDVYITVPTDTISRNVNIEVLKGNVYLTLHDSTGIVFKSKVPEIVNPGKLNLNKLNEGAIVLDIAIKHEGKLYVNTDL